MPVAAHRETHDATTGPGVEDTEPVVANLEKELEPALTTKRSELAMMVHGNAVFWYHAKTLGSKGVAESEGGVRMADMTRTFPAGSFVMK